MNPLRHLRGQRWLTAVTLLGAGVTVAAFEGSDHVKASSVYPAPLHDPGYSAEFAFDGDLNTRWASGGSPFPAWLQIDPGGGHRFRTHGRPLGNGVRDGV